jgi:hypothetical protein
MTDRSFDFDCSVFPLPAISPCVGASVALVLGLQGRRRREHDALGYNCRFRYVWFLNTAGKT